jgi:hypothetical protein
MIFSSGWPVIMSESCICIDDEISQRATTKEAGGTHKDAPKIDKGEQTEVEGPVQREEEDEEVVRDGLEVAVDGVERVRCERRRDCARGEQVLWEGLNGLTEPLVVRFMEELV